MAVKTYENIKNILISKEGTTISDPENYGGDFNALETLINNMWQVRDGNYDAVDCGSHGASFNDTGEMDLDYYNTYANNLPACTCDSALVPLCTCDVRTGPCDCVSRTDCSCDLRDIICSCESRDGSCSCNTRISCDCNGRTSCDCNTRTSCSCNARTSCSCNARNDCDCRSRTSTNCPPHELACDCHVYGCKVGTRIVHQELIPFVVQEQIMYVLQELIPFVVQELLYVTVNPELMHVIVILEMFVIVIIELYVIVSLIATVMSREYLSRERIYYGNLCNSCYKTVQ